MMNSKQRNFVLVITATLLMTLFVANGILLSRRKPLWNDEIYTQINIIEKSTYGQLLSGRIAEGNNFPLFYVLQKSFLCLNQFKPNIVWDGEWEIYDPHAQIQLRILPNIFMSSAILTFVLFFWQTFGPLAGLFSLVLSLTSVATWSFWVEARPYSLWFLLTTWQSLAVFEAIRKTEKAMPVPLGLLMTIHALLCLTTPLSFIQVSLAGSAIIFLRSKNFKTLFFLIGIPFLVWLPYWMTRMHIKLQMTVPWPPLILENIPADQWFLFVFFFLLCGKWFLQTKVLRQEEKESRNPFPLSTACLPHFSAMLILSLALLVHLSIHNARPAGFEVPSRYFMFLVPSAIILTTAIFIDLYISCRDSIWGKFNLILLGCGLLMIQTLNTMITIFRNGIYF